MYVTYLTCFFGTTMSILLLLFCSFWGDHLFCVDVKCREGPHTPLGRLWITTPLLDWFVIKPLQSDWISNLSASLCGYKKKLLWFSHLPVFSAGLLGLTESYPRYEITAVATNGTTDFQWHGKLGECTFASDRLSCCNFTIATWKTFHLTSWAAHFALSWNRLCVCCLSVKTIWPWKWDENTLDQVRNYLIHNFLSIGTSQILMKK